MKDGGQAFPSTTEQYHGEGMTLRDYFAGQALVGLLSAFKSTNDKPEEVIIKDVTSLSYTIADAMIKERNK